MGNRFVGRTGTNSDWVLYIGRDPQRSLELPVKVAKSLLIRTGRFAMRM